MTVITILSRLSHAGSSTGLAKAMSHAGINAEDPRNAGIVGYLKPEPVTLESVVRRLGRVSEDKTDTEIRAQATQLLRTIESKPHRPAPPLSQPVEQAPHPWFGLGTHPDLIEALWKLDGSLPERCRWLLWGYPALVHPRSGVVFGVARGTIGLFLRLPEEVLADEDTKAPATVGPLPDARSALSDWRLIRQWNALAGLGMRAYAGVE